MIALRRRRPFPTARLRMVTWRPRWSARTPTAQQSQPADLSGRLTDAELNAIQAADRAEERAMDARRWTRHGEVRVACAGCDADVYVPLRCAASLAYCRTNSWACFPPEG